MKIAIVAVGMLWALLILVIVVRTNNSFNNEVDSIVGTDNLVKVITGAVEGVKDSRVKKLTPKEMLKQRVKEEKVEEKYVPKKLKVYPNEILPEERAVRMYPLEEREIGVSLNIDGTARVKVKSNSKDVSIISNPTIDVSGDFCIKVAPKIKIKVNENAKVNQKVKILLSADGLDTETIIVTIEPKPKDMKGISMYYDIL